MQGIRVESRMKSKPVNELRQLFLQTKDTESSILLAMSVSALELIQIRMRNFLVLIHWQNLSSLFFQRDGKLLDQKTR